MRPGGSEATTPTAGSISLDVADFPWTLYLRTLERKISDQWIAQKTAVGGEKTVVLFEIGRDGQLVREPAVERSSGNAIYDQSALRAVMDASPFAPLPPGFRRPSLRIRFGFEFRPDQK